MSIEIRAEGYTATCDSCGRSWRSYECLPTEPAIRVALVTVDDWDVDGSEAYCPRCCGERLLDARLTAFQQERDAARAVARVLAHAYTHDSRPPDEVVREAMAYPVGEEKGSA